jgi:transcriptional regulator with XRE-family HTH domain
VTQENTEKPEKPAAKSAELKARIRHAATLRYLYNITHAELAEKLGVSVHTIADWKRRPEWDDAVSEIAIRQADATLSELLAMAPYARDVFHELMRDAPPAVRLQAAQAVLRLALHPTTGSRP